MIENIISGIVCFMVGGFFLAYASLLITTIGSIRRESKFKRGLIRVR